MKTLKCVLALFAFVGLMLVGCSDESQSPVAPLGQGSLEKQPTITPFTGADYPIPPYVTDPGIVKVQGQKMITHGLTMTERWESTSDLMDGTWINVVNTVVDKNTGEGEVYGDVTITPTRNVGGKWIGSYHGKVVQSETPGIWTCTLKGLGHGRGGIIDGMKYKVDVVLEVYGFPVAGWFGQLTGNIYSH